MITNIPFEEVDRIHVFKHLSVNEIDNTINMTIFENLLKEYYSDFITFCDTVKKTPDKIKSISCYINDGILHFDVEEKEEEE